MARATRSSSAQIHGMLLEDQSGWRNSGAKDSKSLSAGRPPRPDSPARARRSQPPGATEPAPTVRRAGVGPAFTPEHIALK